MTRKTQKHILLVGGGHAHALLLHHLIDHPIPDTRITVIDPGTHAPYTGMLPGYVAGHYTSAELHINIKSLTEHVGGEFIQDKAVSADPVRQTVTTATDLQVAYDIVSYDVGIHAQRLEIPGAQQYAVGVKPLGTFADEWVKFIKQQITQPKITILGGGVAGVEMAMAMHHAVRQMNPVVTVIDRNTLLSDLPERSQKFLTKELYKKNINVIEDQSIKQLTTEGITLDNNQTIPSDFILSAMGAVPYSWIKDTGLNLQDGYIAINQYLQTNDYPNVFAVGDCAHFTPRPLPKAGVYAVREAPILYHNLKALIKGNGLKAFNPQADFLKLISLGEKRALADKWGLCFSGHWLWLLKNHIDQKFMNQFKITSSLS